MSSVTAVLLMYFGEEEAFWALHSFMVDAKFAMHGFYICGFPRLIRFLSHHDKVMKKFLPKLKKHFDKHNMDSVLYALKWFFVIFVERVSWIRCIIDSQMINISEMFFCISSRQIPFSLCLRIWDIYLLLGARVVTAMSYTILKLHANRLLKFKDMDPITDFLQYKLYKNFGYSDNFAIKSLENSLIELRSKRLDLPPPADENELPKCEFGEFVEPTIEKKLGLRSALSNSERNVTEFVITRNEELARDDDGDDTQTDDAYSQHFSTGR